MPGPRVGSEIGDSLVEGGFQRAEGVFLVAHVGVHEGELVGVEEIPARVKHFI
jgi:hypothetical protein